MRFRGIAYRAHDPRWIKDPVSGEGARIHGGRFNPQSVPALYLSLSVSTCGLEMGHGFEKLFSALTLVSYKLDVSNVVDLTSANIRRKNCIMLDQLGCAWEDDLGKGRRPPSWIVAEKLIANGANGIRVQSFAANAASEDVNIVLWKWSATRPHQVLPYDPDGRLSEN